MQTQAVASGECDDDDDDDDGSAAGRPAVVCPFCADPRPPATEPPRGERGCREESGKPPDHFLRYGHTEVTLRSPRGHTEVTLRSHRGHTEVTQRSHRGLRSVSRSPGTTGMPSGNGYRQSQTETEWRGS